jgi:hypothetical protein
LRIDAQAIAVVLLACARDCAQAASLDLNERFGPEPQSTTMLFPFAVSEAHSKLNLDIGVKLTAGRFTLRVLDPTGMSLREFSAQELTQKDTPPLSPAVFFRLK